MVERYNPDLEDNGISPLRAMREKRGVTQKEMAKAVGVSEETYRRLERGRVDDPGVRLMQNCALALGTSIYNVIPKEWRWWTVFSPDAAAPPEWESFFNWQREGADDTEGTELPDEVVNACPDEWIYERNKALFGE